MNTQQQTSVEAATKQLKEAEGELAEAQTDLQNFVSHNFRSSAAGLIYFSAENRDVLDQDLKELVVMVDRKKAAFHKALGVWSALK